jgi:hypothetical protein
MTTKPDVEQTAQAIEQAAQRFQQAAGDLERLAAKLRERGDLNLASEALMTSLNVMQSARLDLLVTRPLRAYEQRDLNAERTTEQN